MPHDANRLSRHILYQVSDFFKQARHRETLRGAALSLLIQIQFVAIQLAVGILLARYLGPDEFGIYSFAMSLIMLLQVLPSNGLETVIIRFTAVYIASQQWRHLKGLWRYSFTAVLSYAVATAIVVILVALADPAASSGAFSSGALLASVFPLLLLPLVALLGAALRAVNPGVVGQLPQFVLRPAAFLTLIVIAVFAMPQRYISPSAALVGQGVAALGACALGLRWLIKNKPQAAKHADATYEPALWSKTALPLALMGGLMLINTQADVIMLGLLSSAHETGIYKVASQGANLVMLALTAANLFIGPRIARLYAGHDLPRLQKMLTASVRVTFAVAFVITAAFWLTGPWLLSFVFGPAYAAAYLPLVILCGGQLINVGCGSVGNVLNMTGRERDAVMAAGASAVLNLILNFFLIPSLGGIGAAIATSLTMMVWNGAMAYRVWYHTRLITPVIFFNVAG